MEQEIESLEKRVHILLKTRDKLIQHRSACSIKLNQIQDGVRELNKGADVGDEGSPTYRKIMTLENKLDKVCGMTEFATS